jgi:hypothetical protein
MKKKVGRPRGRVKPHRPPLSLRIPQELYDSIQAAAAQHKRSMNEEIIWRMERIFPNTPLEDPLEIWGGT